ncbi:MAG TPA: DUF924 domain-containing protein [Cyanobacteria bacterium UBA11369]|nr:DUF924 domain-containing protein [Cyanobacteria bacterium UBA11371]HBE31890.1 DUF924 domain-containing protein [Cyanobacteria bacterium UBA11368]HBE53122.1 DUF924 domain-containing protein [Cyanobacteria bacterium UBA11369]
MSQFQEILNFWFGNPDESSYGKPRQFWFASDPEFDIAVRSHFQTDYELAASGKLDEWKNSPQSCLALIILLDQIPRNIFRGEPKAFATDSQALSAAKHAVNRGFDRELLPVQRWFIYLPFEHSENLADQHQSVELWHGLSEYPDCADAINYAIQHLKIIERFGRFPHRNKILGRETTPEEAEFLKQPNSSF